MADYTKYQWDIPSGTVKHGGSVGGVTLDTHLLDKITAEVSKKISMIIQDVGNETVSEIYRLSPEDTGEMKDSYLRESRMIDEHTFRIQDGVGYAIFVELGTSKMAAQPHVIPALEEAESELIYAAQVLFFQEFF